MKGKIVTILVCMLMLSTVAGSLPSTDKAIQQTNNETESSNMGYSHDILGEFFTLTTCVPCKYSHRALKNLYAGEYHPFEYITMVYDNQEFGGNKWAKQRHDELEVEASPTVMWDGPFKKDQSSNEDIEEDMEDYNASIIACGNRNVKDIDLNLDVEWLGAVNQDPYDDETLVSIEQIMTWENSEMEIDVEVISHEASQYNGHFHVYVTEVNSTLWDDKWGDPYTHAFLDYAWNEDVTFSGAGTWDDTVIWDGYDHNTGYPENDQDYGNITQDNILVVASIFDEDNNDYADETTSVRTGYDTDPKYFDVYFGNTTPPPLVAENKSAMEWFNKSGPLEFGTKYYWQVDIWDNNGDFFPGEEWSFTTRGNDPPNEPSGPNPVNESTGESIKVNLTWVGGDPDGDDVTYDIWFGEIFPQWNMEQIAYNQTKTWKVVENLDFNKMYYWYVVAWEVGEYYDLYTVGPLWHFSTEANVPPNPAIDPRPYDGDPAVPTEGVILKWNGSDDNFGDILTYDIYFDDVNPPTTLQEEGYTDNEYELEYPLSPFKRYYWQIDTTDREGEFTPGNIWTFYCGVNHPPTDPIVDGPVQFKPNVEKEFTFVSDDPDNHSIYYVVDWDDGQVYETDLFPHNEVVTLSHEWDNTGTYVISARAYDEHNKPSDESTEFEVVVTNSKTFNFKLLEWMFIRLPNMFPLLRQLFGL